MRVIVDSLLDVRGALEAELREMMRLDAERRLGGEAAPPGGPRPFTWPSATPDPLLQAQTLSAGVTTSLFQLDVVRRQIDQYRVEIHKKYSIPVACLVFVLVGVPLGIMSRRGGFGTAATLSLGFFIIYWACLIGGEKLADRDIVSPFVGMWAANIVIGAVGVYLTVRSAKETLLINWGFLQRFVPKRLRGSPANGAEGGGAA
jgi:lipopolysaccharide export LptBFGC system permease protein LptF